MPLPPGDSEGQQTGETHVDTNLLFTAAKCMWKHVKNSKHFGWLPWSIWVYLLLLWNLFESEASYVKSLNYKVIGGFILFVSAKILCVRNVTPRSPTQHRVQVLEENLGIFLPSLLIHFPLTALQIKSFYCSSLGLQWSHPPAPQVRLPQHRSSTAGWAPVGLKNPKVQKKLLICLCPKQIVFSSGQGRSCQLCLEMPEPFTFWQ